MQSSPGAVVLLVVCAAAVTLASNSQFAGLNEKCVSLGARSLDSHTLTVRGRTCNVVCSQQHAYLLGIVKWGLKNNRFLLQCYVQNPGESPTQMERNVTVFTLLFFRPFFVAQYVKDLATEITETITPCGAPVDVTQQYCSHLQSPDLNLQVACLTVECK